MTYKKTLTIFLSDYLTSSLRPESDLPIEVTEIVTQKRSNTIGHDAGLLHTPIECEFSAPSWVERLDQHRGRV